MSRAVWVRASRKVLLGLMAWIGLSAQDPVCQWVGREAFFWDRGQGVLYHWNLDHPRLRKLSLGNQVVGLHATQDAIWGCVGGRIQVATMEGRWVLRGVLPKDSDAIACAPLGDGKVLVVGGLKGHGSPFRVYGAEPGEPIKKIQDIELPKDTLERLRTQVKFQRVQRTPPLLPLPGGEFLVIYQHAGDLFQVDRSGGVKAHRRVHPGSPSGTFEQVETAIVAAQPLPNGEVLLATRSREAVEESRARFPVRDGAGQLLPPEVLHEQLKLGNARFPDLEWLAWDPLERTLRPSAAPGAPTQMRPKEEAPAPFSFLVSKDGVVQPLDPGGVEAQVSRMAPPPRTPTQEKPLKQK